MVSMLLSAPTILCKYIENLIHISYVIKGYHAGI
jgi:hypothetical protein